MRTWKFTETQIVSILKQADAGVSVMDHCRRAGISTAAYYQWRSKYDGLEASELRRVKELDAENTKLKRMYAEMALDNVALKDLAVGPTQKCEAALPDRSACSATESVLWLSRAVTGGLVRDAELISALASLVEERPSRGFWKCSNRLRKKRPDWNPKRIYRVYKASGSTCGGRPSAAFPSANVWRRTRRSCRIPSGRSTS